MKKSKLPKKPKATTLQDVYQQQADFVDRMVLVQWLLGRYIHDKRNFDVFIDEEVQEYYRFNINETNPENVWDSISTLVDDVEEGTWGTEPKKYLGLKQCGGLIAKIAFVPKKKKITVEELGNYVCSGDFSTEFPPEKVSKK